MKTLVVPWRVLSDFSGATKSNRSDPRKPRWIQSRLGGSPRTQCSQSSSRWGNLSSTILPEKRRMKRASESSGGRRGSFVVMRSVVPFSLNSPKRASTFGTSPSPRWAVGSSARRTTGSLIVALATATSCCSPRDRFEHGMELLCLNPICLRVRSTFSSMECFRLPERKRGKATLS